jgi:hypothetical protein
MDQMTIAAANTLWNFHCIYDDPAPSDIIIGLGSYDLRVVDRCAELFHQGMAPKLLFTGHSGHWTRDRFDASEAKIFARRAAELSVPENAILLEESATNIGENITFSAQIVGRQAAAILVTKPQTQRRVFATVTKQWPEASARITAPLHGFSAQPTTDFPTRHLICEMVGDLKRIQDYPDAGFQTKQEIPPEVMAANELLIAKGYTDHP